MSWDEKALLKAAIHVRNEIEDFVFGQDRFNFDPENLQGACAIASYTLHRTLNNLHIPNRFVMGWFRDKWSNDENHCWLEVGEHIVDITATQFGISDKVYVTKPGFPYIVSCYDDIALNKLRLFWVSQGPTKYKNVLHRIANITVKEVQNYSRSGIL